MLTLTAPLGVCFADTGGIQPESNRNLPRNEARVPFARIVKVKPGEQHPHLQRWRSAMAQRSSMAL